MSIGNTVNLSTAIFKSPSLVIESPGFVFVSKNGPSPYLTNISQVLSEIFD